MRYTQLRPTLMYTLTVMRGVYPDGHERCIPRVVPGWYILLPYPGWYPGGIYLSYYASLGTLLACRCTLLMHAATQWPSWCAVSMPWAQLWD